MWLSLSQIPALVAAAPATLILSLTPNQQPTSRARLGICQEAVTFINASTGQSLFGYQWTFDGGTPASTPSANPSAITFAGGAGTYDITLMATTFAGCSDEVTKTLTINSNPVANFFFDAACVGVPFQFYSSSSVQNDSITGYNWQVNRGSSIGISPNPSAKKSTNYFSEPVCLAVNLTVTSSQGCVKYPKQEA